MEKPDEIYELYESMKYTGDFYEIYNLQYCKKLPISENHLFIWSDMGTGKTTQVEDFISNNPELSICFISNRISFTFEIFNKFKKYGFENYLDTVSFEKQENPDPPMGPKSGIVSNRIIIQIESLHKLLKCNYDLIIIDEAFSLFSQVYSPTNKNKIYINQQKLQLLFENCKKSILLDAHLLTPIYNFYNQLCGGNLKVIKNEYVHNKGKVKFYDGDKFEFIKYIIDDLIDGKKICLPTNAKNFGDYVIETLKDIDNMLVDYSDEERQILKNIKYVFYNEKNKFKSYLIANEEFKKYDLVIYSPTITTGIDITEVYFDKIYAYCTNQSNDVFSFLQMLHRVRHLKPCNRRNNYVLNIYYSLTSFNNSPENLTIEGISSYYEIRKNITEAFIPSKTITCTRGYFQEFYNNDIFTKYYFEKLRINEISKMRYDMILEDLLKHKGYVIDGNILLKSSDASTKTLDFIKDKIIENKINLFENAELLTNKQLNENKNLIKNSIFEETSEQEILHAFFSIEKTKIKSKVIDECEFTGEEYFEIYSNKYYYDNLLCESKLSNSFINELIDKELDQKYNHEKTSKIVRYKLFSMFKNITKYTSFNNYEISTKIIEDNTEQLINFFDFCKIYLGKSYEINKESKRMTTSIMSKIKKFTLSWSGLGYEKKRKRINGKIYTIYKLDNLNETQLKYIENQIVEDDIICTSVEDLLKLY